MSERIDEKKQDGESSEAGLYVFLGIICFTILPAILIGYLLFFILFRTLKYKNKFSIPVILIPSVLMSCLLFFLLPDTLVAKYILATSVLGPVIGIILCLTKASQLKRHPEEKMKSGPYYNFEYRENIIDKLRRDKLKKRFREW